MNLISKVKVVYESNDVLVVHKPSFLPTVPLKKDGDDKLTLLKIIEESYPEITKVNGYNYWERGVLHRLDNNTSGLVLVAKNQQSFDYLAKSQKIGFFKKEYRAISKQGGSSIDGYGEYPYDDIKSDDEIVIGSMFRFFGKGRSLVLPVLPSYSPNVVKKAVGRWYSTKVKYLETQGDRDIFSCSLSVGFKHQVRTHLAWAGFPLEGDVQYGGIESEEFGLHASSISFIDPKTEQELIINDNNF